MTDSKGLYRSRRNSIIGGVAGGIAEALDIDPVIIRVIFVLLVFAGGSGGLLYLILWIVLPLDPEYDRNFKNSQTMNNSFNEDPLKKEPDPWSKPKNDGTLIAGLILIALGIIFLIIRFVPRIDFGDLWPVILLVAGIALIWSSFSKHKKV